MSDALSHSPEAISLEDWAGEMGARWLANLTGFENTIAPVGDALLAHAAYALGERVVDIGFGGGATSLAIADAVAPGGDVLGIDISPDLVAATTRRAAAAGITNARFVCADAAKVALTDKPYDRLCSRFGSMFFAEPVAAFANLRTLLAPGARIDLAVWAAPQANAWLAASMAMTRRHIDLPAPVPGAPGPFAFDDPAYLQSILQRAGFTAVDFVAVSGQLPVGGPNSTPESALDFASNALSTGRLLLEYPDSVQQAVAADLLELYTRHHRADEGVMMGYSVWLVSALA